MKWSLKNKIQPMLVSKDRNLNIRTEVEEKKESAALESTGNMAVTAGSDEL